MKKNKKSQARYIFLSKRILITIFPKINVREFKPTKKDYDINLGYIKPNTRLL